MNKIFKIVWNNSIGSYTVVSELTKSKSKGATCTTVAAVMLLAASQALAGTGTTTSGGNALPSGTDYKFCYYDDNSKNVVCGDSSTTAADVVGGNKPGKSVAIGLSAKTAGESNVALGANSSASSTSGLAIGADSKAHHNQTVAIGERANALGEADVAIGKAASENATSTGRNIAVGEGALRNAAAANNVIGIGTGAAQNINGQHVIAIGTDANQGVSNVNQVVAIGYKSSAVTSQSVAVGTLSSAKGIGSLALGNSSNAATENSVAVGRFSQAAGANSIAVGGGRSAAQSARAGGTYSIAVGAGAEATHAQSIAMGLSAGAKGTGTMAVGDSAQASKNYAIAIGNKAEASGEKSVVIGSNETATNIAKATGRQSVAIGWTAQATGFTQAVAIGPDSQASGGQSTSIGNNTRANGNSSIAIGSDDWDLTKVQVDADYQRLTGTAMSTGYQSTEAAEAAIAVGVKTQATGALSTAFGPGARATKVGASAFGVGAEADKEKAVAIGAGSRTSTVATPVTSATVNGVTYSGFAGATKITDGSQISIGTAGYERQIKHVAPGEISATSTDAINGSQLYHVAAQAANPLKFDGDSGTTVERKLGATLNVRGGATGTLTDNNIGVVADNASNTLRLKLAQNVDLGNAGSLKTGNTTVNNNGLTITGGPSITKTGISAGNKPITNVASGGTTDSNAANIGDVKTAAAAAKTAVKQGANTTVSSATDAATGATEYTVNAEKSVVQGSPDVTVNAVTNGLTTTYTADLSTTAKASLAKADSALQNIGIQVNGTTAKTLNQANSTLNFVNGAGTTAENKNGNIAFNVNKANLSVNGGTVSADKQGDEFATAKSVADAINQAVTNSEKTSVVAAGDNTHVASAVSGNQTTYTVHADKTTVSAKTGGKLTVASAQTANGNQTKTTNYELDLTDDAKTSLAKADSAVQKVVSSNPNLTASKTGDTVTLDFSQTPSFTSVTTGNSKLSSDGLKIGSGANSVSLTNAGLSNGGNKITNIADGAADTDAASYKQVKAAKTEVQAGTNVASVTKTDNPTDGHAVYTVNAKAAAVTLENGADGLKLTSSEDTASNLTTYKLDLADKTRTSLAKADSALQNIGVQVNGTAAKTLTKDDSTLNFVNGTGTTAENKNGDIAFNVNKANLSVNGGTVSADKQGDEFATAKSVADAINQAVTNSEKTSVVAAGDNTHVASAVSGNQTTYTVHADKTTVSAKTGGKLALNPTEVTNGNQTKTTNYELDLTDDAKAEIAKGVEAKTAVDTKGIGFAADSGSPVTKKLGDSLNIKGDNKNIETVAGSGGINVKLKDQITVKTAKADTFKAGDSTLNSDGLKISNGANPVELTKSGLNNGGNKITKVAKGTADTDAVNLAQLKDAAAAASNKVESGNANIVVKPVNNADGSTTYKVATADKLTADSFTAGNTVVNNGGVKVGNAVALGNDGLKAGNVSVGTNGINAGNHTVKNVAKGVNDTDAVNVAQLREQIAAGAKTTTVVAGKNVTVSNKVSGNNTEYTVNAEKTTVSAAAGGAVKVNAGTKNADGVTDYAVDLTDAAKADVAKGVAAKNTVDNKGLTFNADGSTTTGVKKLGDTVAINGDGNIITKADANGIQIGLNKNLNVQSVKAGDTTLNNSGVAVGGNVALTQNGLKAGNVNVSAGGIDAGGNKITRVAPGVVAAGSTDAVNGGQLYAVNQAARAAKTEVVAGKNIVVTESQGANGQSVYQVATSDNLTVGSVKAGATTVNDRGISIALPTAHDPENAVSLSPDGLNNGGQRISNVAPGRVGTDAVNLNQLAGLGNALQNNIDRVGKKAYSGVAGAIAQGSIPQVTRPGATGIGVGSGYYGGQSAMAIGVSAMSDGGNWIVKGNFSANTGGHVGVGAGALYQW